MPKTNSAFSEILASLIVNMFFLLKARTIHIIKWVVQNNKSKQTDQWTAALGKEREGNTGGLWIKKTQGSTFLNGFKCLFNQSF